MKAERKAALDAARPRCPDCHARGHRQVVVYVVATRRHVFRCTGCGAIHDGRVVAGAPTA